MLVASQYGKAPADQPVPAQVIQPDRHPCCPQPGERVCHRILRDCRGLRCPPGRRVVGPARGRAGGGQLRPAMTPPSTFQMAPVTQLVAGDSRKVMVLARSRAVPTRPSGWKLSKLCRVSSSLSLGTNRSYSGVATTAGATALTRMWCGASSMARLWVSACSPALATEYAEDGVAAMAWWAHMLPLLTAAPPRPASTIPLATVWVRKKIARSSSR